MITINVLFFAAFREQLDCGQLQLNVSNDLTVADLKQQLAEKGSKWHTVFSSNTLIIAVNQELVEDEHRLQDNDEVAFFPPVTGG